MIASKVFYNFSNSKFMNKHVDKVIRDDIYAARLLVCSNVLKDAVVYAFRFDKSRKNQEIPKEKRSFVAAMDLASGVTTSLVQLSLGFAISNRKLQKRLCDKLFGHLQSKAPELYDVAKKGFIAAAALIGSGVIGERVLVPLLATPIASLLKDKISKNKTSEITKSDVEIQYSAHFSAKNHNDVFIKFMR